MLAIIRLPGAVNARPRPLTIICLALATFLGSGIAFAQQLAPDAKADTTCSKSPPTADVQNALAPKTGWRLKGFVQTRVTDYTSSSGGRGPTKAEVTRLRPTLGYDPDAHFHFNLQWDMTTRGRPFNSVNGRDDYVEYHNGIGGGDYGLWAGQAKVPFGYEEYVESDQDRAAVERARILTVFFPNERDTGVFFGTWRQGALIAGRNPLAPSYVVALLNGDGIDRYYGEIGKSICLRVSEPVTRTQTVGASLFTGRSRLSAGFERVKQALGLEYQGRYLRGKLGAQAEFLWGRAYGQDQYGGYEQIEYAPSRPVNLFVRHDLYNPNTHAGSNMWNRTAIGFYRELRERGHAADSWRLTAEYDIISNRLKAAQENDTFAIQLQWQHQ